MKPMKKLNHWVLSIALMTVAFTAFGNQHAFVGSRASGMGGANTASTRDSTAIWQNPAAFGFMGREWETNHVDNGNLSGQGFSMEVFSASVGYALTEDLGRYLDILSGIDFSNFESGNLSDTGENVQSLLAVAGIVGSLNKGDAIYADANAGLSIQMGHLGLGVRVFGEGVGYAIPDRDNLSLTSFVDGPAIASDIRDASATDPNFTSAGYAFTVLTPDQQTDMGASLGVASDDDSIKYVDYSLQRLANAGDLEGSEISAAIDAINEFLPGSGGSIDSNQTAVVGRGFFIAEIPVSYGWALNENFSFGVTAKAMFGSVLGTQIWIFDEDNEEVLNDLSDNVNNSVNFGLDLGMLYRLNNFQFALVGHNLNRPKFDGFTETVTVNGVSQNVKIPDVKLDPQVTFGAAFIPVRRVVLETSIDLLETGTSLDGYDIQRIAFGGEVDLWAVALRLGAYQNIANSWQDYWVATAGLGANIFGIKVDIGGAYALTDTVDFDGTELPTEARLFASFGLDF